ncbi:type III secretion system export apparatus subunit SctT [Paraburkholderia humisilvae]|uniref:Surface presentation of antigens protein SpaR n=1 Tax=Paraburkholderia humisilvae TaxID=627669 RepID=A0A6J5ECW6_9BURK|nr:type III secretion system export apparatus subunit SctT [Paraburkholderia humisilvae]CAB3764328.1 Surface presentation of antigens protein SpaR [Paraburkholderia humisilvae]
MNALATLPQVSSVLDGYLTLIGVCSLRLYVMMVMLPPTADGVLQGVVKNAIVILFSSYVAYGQPAALLDTLHGVVLFELAVREGLIGLVLGFSASIVFWVATAAGAYIDDLAGYNNVQLTHPLSSEQSTPTSTLLEQIAIMAFWSLGGMTFLLGALYQSYQWWPLASAHPDMSSIIESFVIRQTDSLMQGVVKLAAPIVFALVLIDLAFALATRSAAKLDLMSLSQPVKGAVTVLLLALFAGLFIDQVKDQITLRDLSKQMQLLVHPDATQR